MEERTITSRVGRKRKIFMLGFSFLLGMPAAIFVIIGALIIINKTWLLGLLFLVVGALLLLYYLSYILFAVRGMIELKGDKVTYQTGIKRYEFYLSDIIDCKQAYKTLTIQLNEKQPRRVIVWNFLYYDNSIHDVVVAIQQHLNNMNEENVCRKKSE